MPKRRPALDRAILMRLGYALGVYYGAHDFRPDAVLPPRLAELMQQLRDKVG